VSPISDLGVGQAGRSGIAILDFAFHNDQYERATGSWLAGLAFLGNREKGPTFGG
jgi:hypothetical protein